ncbi:3'-5' DNA helicase, partial [Nowakowskiella sp. JEL0078]
MAPTKPLVNQQISACYKITGIPKSSTVILTGSTHAQVCKQQWKSKRVFYVTPQSIENDLQNGICLSSEIVLLVVDEAHRATGHYSYTEVVRYL